MSVIEELDTAMVDTVRTIAREVAAKHADDVDRNARFPGETVEALRDAFALSAFVPREYGGAGASMSTIARCCLELGRECSNSAMVFAMHQIQVASIVRHIEPGSWFEDYLRRLVVEQRLIASVTSEVGTGGDMGSSIAAVIPAADGTASFEKDAPTVSYGIHADDLLTTLRSGPHAERNDQVLALSSRDQHHLEITGTWDVLGMRGTCSAGGVVSATFDRHQVLETPFSKVAVESMVPVSHILWANVWLGIAEDAFCRTRAFVKAAG
jgi:acyl-CoA dehydrogenase